MPVWIRVLRAVSLVWGTVVLVLGAGIVVASLFGNPQFNDVALYLGFAALALMLVYLITPAYREVERMELQWMAAQQGGRGTHGRRDLQLVTIARARMRSMRLSYILASAGSGAFGLYGVLLLTNRHFSGWFSWDSGWWGVICLVFALTIFMLPIIIYNLLMTHERIVRRVEAIKAQGVEIIDRPLQLPADDRTLGRPEQGGHLVEGGDRGCRSLG
ncbi:MAG: hypothetical protein DLM69_09775 [Candidatus Chloroheliales bacterium]|nr:MAG: hypothetical protein DLM69_09775 [Chloroflexota bacterium]